jgi:hypothetical protein
MRDSTRSKIEVDLRLEHPVDLGNCSLSIEVLEFLNIKSLPLTIDNLEGIHPFRPAVAAVLKRMRTDIPANLHSARYLATKRDDPAPCRPA